MTESIIGSPEVRQIEGEDMFTKYKLQPVEVIDQGACGEIVLASSLQKPEIRRIVKKFTLLDEEKKERNMKVFQAEVKFMQSFKHPYMMKCLLAVQCSEYLAICMYYYHRRTLDYYFDQLSPELSELCVTQVACALRYMHKNHVAHLDVKLDNIFMDSDFNAVLGDFGCAEELAPHQETLPKKECGGTSSYFAPERRGTQDDKQVNPYKLDSYCLGVVLWALVMRRNPDVNISYYLEARRKRDLPSHIRRWLLKLLEKNPSMRPTVTYFLTRLRQEGSFRHIIDTC